MQMSHETFVSVPRKVSGQYATARFREPEWKYFRRKVKFGRKKDLIKDVRNSFPKRGGVGGRGQSEKIYRKQLKENAHLRKRDFWTSGDQYGGRSNLLSV